MLEVLPRGMNGQSSSWWIYPEYDHFSI